MADANGASGSIGTPRKKANPNPGGGSGSIGTPKPTNPNPGGGTGSIGAPVGQVGTVPATNHLGGNAAGAVAAGVNDLTSTSWTHGVGNPWAGPPKPAPTPTPAAPAAPPAPADPAAPGAGTDTQNGAYAVLYNTLNTYGLGSLAQTAWNKLLAGEQIDQILNIDLPQTEEYKQRFAGNVALQAKGLTPLQPGQYLDYETAVRQQAQLYGIDPSATSQQAIAGLIGAGVSASEATSRLATYYQATQQIDPAARDYLAKNYGITTGNLMDIFMNPDQHLATVQAKVNAAGIGGAAQRTGWGQLDAAYAMRLAQSGETTDQALSSFDKLAGMSELTKTLGDNTGSVSQADELAAEFDGNAAAQQKLSNVAAGRAAAFAGGGQYAAGNRGVSSLKDPNSQF